MAKNKIVILVRGEGEPEKTIWRFFHLGPGKDVDFGYVKLVYFDFPNEQILTWNSWKPRRGKRREEAIDNKPETVVDMAIKIHARIWEYKDPVVGEEKIKKIEQDKQRASVLSLYNYIKEQSEGSIVSLQFFTHGHDEGPILWKKVVQDVGAKLNVDRDPHDTEPRDRDFFGNNPLAGDEGKKFSKSFARGAFVKLWGCDAKTYKRRILHHFLDKEEDNIDGVRDLDYYLQYSVLFCYALLLSRLLGVTVWAAPPGWGTTYDDDGGKKTYKEKYPPDLSKNYWWRVSEQDPIYQAIFKDIFSADLDPLGYVGFRYYGWYAKSRMKYDLIEALRTLWDPNDMQNYDDQGQYRGEYIPVIKPLDLQKFFQKYFDSQ